LRPARRSTIFQPSPNWGADDAGAVNASIFPDHDLDRRASGIQIVFLCWYQRAGGVRIGPVRDGSFLWFVSSSAGKKSSTLELAGIGAIALVLVIAAFGLMLWSGFSLSLDGVLIPGPYWVMVGMVTALLVTTKQHAL
jgi:hypothetical protein